MKGFRAITGVGLGALVAAAIAVSPALGFPGQDDDAPHRPATLGFEGGIGSFTPAAADPRLAAALARSGLGSTSGFRFTPSERHDGDRHDVTVAVRARSSHTAARNAREMADNDDLRITPIAYDLGVAVGWKRFAISGDVTRLDLGAMPGSRKSADIGISYTGRRVSARVKVGTERPINDAPALIQDAPSSMIDVGGSYSLTRNLDVTAGVRYKSEQARDRLQRLDDNRRDSQAVYIGTAFRF
ncbi:MAG TPA: hypothetical protein VFT56_01450 [Sphingomonas sp.]|nr:hypothetical protein [Sphingomonas sp.]